MSDFWKCKGCGGLVEGNFRMGLKNNDGKAIYVVDCPTCTHSGYKTDDEIEHSYKAAKKRWVLPEEELEGLTQNQLLRQHGFHEIANMHTDTINPKKDVRYGNRLYNDELRKKKVVKAKPKRKPVKKVTKNIKSKK